MMYEELFSLTDDLLIYKTMNYLFSIRENIALDTKSKEEILKSLDDVIFYLKFHQDVTKGQGSPDEIEDLKEQWKNFDLR